MEAHLLNGPHWHSPGGSFRALTASTRQGIEDQLPALPGQHGNMGVPPGSTGEKWKITCLLGTTKRRDRMPSASVKWRGCVGVCGSSIPGSVLQKPQLLVGKVFSLVFNWNKTSIAKRIFCCEVILIPVPWLGITVFLGAFLFWPMSVGGSGLEASVAPWRRYMRGKKETPGTLCHVVPQVPRIHLPSTFQSLSVLLCYVRATVF